MPPLMSDETPPTSAAESHGVPSGSEIAPVHYDIPSARPVSSNSGEVPPEETRTYDNNLPIHGQDDHCRDLGLGKNQREELSARLLDPIEISLNKSSEVLREKTQGASKILPTFVYRTFYGTSVALSSWVSKDTHVKHRGRETLKIRKGNTFQAVGEVNFRRDLTKPRVERQLIWNKKRDPSSYISMFNKLGYAVRRADFHYSTGHRIGHRVSIAKISTADLVPTTIYGICETTWAAFTKVYLGESINSTVTTRPVDIPVWVSAHVKPADGSSITMNEFEEAKTEIWMSITELRASNMDNQPHGHERRKMPFANGHNYEWLALGSIPESRIVKIMPWDGKDTNWPRR